MTPPGRALAGWWRQLASHAPVRIWFADFTVFRLEVLARCNRPTVVAPLSRLILNALTVFPASSLESLARRLGISPTVLRGFLTELRNADLAATDETGAWHATAKDATEQSSLERHTFCFTSDLAFLPLTGHGMPATEDAPPGLLESLHECVARPADWKQSHGFPTDVVAILDAAAEGAEDLPWQRIPVCQTENVLLAIVELPDHSIVGFSTSAEAWTLAAEPALKLATADALPERTDPPSEMWIAAWREWCQPVRGASPEDVTTAVLERRENRLHVRVAPRLFEKLKVMRPEAFRGDSWLLAGEGTVKSAVVLEIEATGA